METKVLVTYATTYGSTQEIAEFVAETLRKSGLAVELQPMRQVQSLAGYQAVVLGAPLYMFHWHKDALRFMKRHEQALKKTPAAVFALGPFNNVEDEWKEVRSELSKELARFPWFAPAAVEVFGGKFDPTHLRFPWNLLPALKKIPASDIRDWEAIRAWAENLPLVKS
ncbi:MAG TPA: flavodoxin domain-containing protein [Anaerolineaceae bacterium]|nr:flavodoxin domain-containing protein [Anaerolineaceae bacterium]